jgi:heat shock protein HtpX
MWEQVRSNQIKSAVLVALMGILLMLLGYFLGLLFWDSAIGGVILALVIWGVMGLVAFFQGDSILLGMADAKKISPTDYPRLNNVVEEMKIASGLEKVPDIYIIDDPALNAFSTGRDEKRASVAITSGLLRKLNRDELQGVIGHEVAHIKNRDVLLMVLLAMLLGSIVILARYAPRFMFMGGGRRSRSSSRGGGEAQLIIIVVGLVLMILAPIAAQLIYFAVSRKREYLADASSALYTRYPEGLASALEKLSTSFTSLVTADEATAPMYFVDPLPKKGLSLVNLTGTHPPIAERVRILRAMGGASLADYERSYHQVKGASVIPATAMTLDGLAGAVALRAPSAETKPVEDFPQRMERARETSDLMWRLNDYKTVPCQCGTTLRIPPNFREPTVKCPHCGRVNYIVYRSQPLVP